MTTAPPRGKSKSLVGLAHSAANDDALPRPGSQGSGHHRLHVVAAVEAEQAGLSTYAVVGEPGHSHFNGICHRLGVPRPGHPIRIEPDHEHARRGGRCVHC